MVYQSSIGSVPRSSRRRVRYSGWFKQPHARQNRCSAFSAPAGIAASRPLPCWRRLVLTIVGQTRYVWQPTRSVATCMDDELLCRTCELNPPLRKPKRAAINADTFHAVRASTSEAIPHSECSGIQLAIRKPLPLKGAVDAFGKCIGKPQASNGFCFLIA